MGAIWFWIVAAMLAAYVVLDGLDLGVGILYPLLARSEDDRRQMLRSIGPVWDGNEVWLIAAGGTLFFAFPLLYASAFSGFYLPLMIVLWLLILRGLGIELRSHVENAVWRSFFDGIFFVASALLAIFYGTALANVIRGVPLGNDRYFFLPLWTNWRAGVSPGILDWYTVLGGIVALIAVAHHGALWLALKTTGDLESRSSVFAKRLWPFLLAVTAISLPATVVARPGSLANYQSHLYLFAVPIIVLSAIAAMAYFRAHKRSPQAFLSSCLYLAMMLVGAAAGLYPVVLPSSSSAVTDITVSEALAGPHAIHVGLVWWSFGILLAVLYFVVSYWLFRGKVSTDTGYGH
jgi:cytochrome d ubiquinol oxidase subunit II